MSELISATPIIPVARNVIYYGGESTYDRRVAYEQRGAERGFATTAWFVETDEAIRKPLKERPRLVAALASAVRGNSLIVVPCLPDIGTSLEALFVEDACRELGIESHIGGRSFGEDLGHLDEVGRTLRGLLDDRRSLVLKVRVHQDPLDLGGDALEGRARADAPVEYSDAVSLTREPVGRYVRLYADDCTTGQKFGRTSPSLPEATAARSIWEPQAAAVAKWLWWEWPTWTQAKIAALLNELGLHGRRGGPFTQPMVSILIRKSR